MDGEVDIKFDVDINVVVDLDVVVDIDIDVNVDVVETQSDIDCVNESDEMDLFNRSCRWRDEWIHSKDEENIVLGLRRESIGRYYQMRLRIGVLLPCGGYVS